MENGASKPMKTNKIFDSDWRDRYIFAVELPLLGIILSP
jgi:hypothetical protein